MATSSYLVFLSSSDPAQWEGDNSSSFFENWRKCEVHDTPDTFRFQSTASEREVYHKVRSHFGPTAFVVKIVG